VSLTENRWKAVPAVRANAKGLKIRVWALWGVLLFGFVMGPLAMCSVAVSKPAPTPASPGPPTPVLAFANSVLNDWLGGRPTTVPLAENVDPGFGFGSEQERFSYIDANLYNSSSSTVDDRVVYHTTYRLRTEHGLYDLSISSTPNRAGQLVLATQPTLIPANVLPGNVPPVVPTVRSNELPEGVQASVNRWADAYAGDNQDQLRVLIAGGPETGIYKGLGGYEVKQPPTLTAPVTREDGYLYVRARVVLTDSSTNEFTMSIDFDLLITQAGTSDARVQAWGVPGSGPTLTPFINNTAL